MTRTEYSFKAEAEGANARGQKKGLRIRCNITGFRKFHGYGFHLQIFRHPRNIAAFGAILLTINNVPLRSVRILTSAFDSSPAVRQPGAAQVQKDSVGP